MTNSLKPLLVLFGVCIHAAAGAQQLPNYEIASYAAELAQDASGNKVVFARAFRVDRVKGKIDDCWGTFELTKFRQNPAHNALSVECKSNGFSVGVNGLKDKQVAVPPLNAPVDKDIEILWLIDGKTGAVQFCHRSPGCVKSSN